MSMMVSFVLSFFPRDVLDAILNLIESVSEDLPSYSYIFTKVNYSLECPASPHFKPSHLGQFRSAVCKVIHASA